MDIYTDYQQWHTAHYQYEEAEKRPADMLRDGVHSVPLGRGLTLDFLSSGFGNPSLDQRHFLVVFRGTLPDKTRKSLAPFFSGMELGKKNRLPLLAVSDPTLALDRRLTLAWYAGNAIAPDLYDRIARSIDAISRATGRTPIIVGGSGGGYASLQALSRITTTGTAIVWNPQTSIGGYYARHVMRYISVAYPGQACQPGNPPNRQAIQDCLEKFMPATVHRLPPAARLGAGKQLVYLQNFTDAFHRREHAGPWLNALAFTSIGNDKVFLSKDRNIVFLPGAWGKGHVGPPGAALDTLIQKISNGATLPAVAEGYLAHAPFAASHRWLAVAPPRPSELDVKFTRHGTELTVSATPSASLGKPGDFQYAFSLSAGRKIISRTTYTPAASATFTVPGKTGDLAIRIGLKDPFSAEGSVTVPVPQ
ncbi:hypothetical protein [Bordetella petrii]|uniref:hypothetical protein n=1 Tax=Bordetella petrii TaxID=94624 RepID=UPI0037336AF4